MSALETLDRIKVDIAKRLDYLEPFVREHDELQEWAGRLGIEPVRTNGNKPAPAPARSMYDELSEPAPEPPSPAPRRRRARTSLEKVRDLGFELRNFNIKDLSDRLGASRTLVAAHVKTLTEKGTFERTGPSRGPKVRWRIPEVEHSELRSTNGHSEERDPGWKTSALVAVPNTRPVGSSGRPGRDRRRQEAGKRVRRSKQS